MNAIRFQRFRNVSRSSLPASVVDRYHAATLVRRARQLGQLAPAAAEGAVVVALDGDFTATPLAAFSHLGRSGQTIVCVDGDSQDLKIRDVVTTERKGRVPQFWQELKARCPWPEEIVEDPDQDRDGIGLLRWLPEDAVRA